MSIFRLIADWISQRGPEHWDPDCDEDVQYLRQKREEAHEAVGHLMTGNIVEEAVTGRLGRIPQRGR